MLDVNNDQMWISGGLAVIEKCLNWLKQYNFTFGNHIWCFEAHNDQMCLPGGQLINFSNVRTESNFICAHLLGYFVTNN